MQGPTSHAANASPSLPTGPGRCRGLAAGLALALGGAAPVWAQNDPNPYYIGLSESVYHNSNINNIAGGPGDTTFGTGIVGGFDQNIGRQHVHGSGNVTYNRYREFRELDNTSYGVNAGWDWQTIDRLSGSVNASANQGLATLQNNLVQQTPANNRVRSYQLGTRAAWGANSVVSVEGGYGFSKTSYSQTTYGAGNSNNSTADIGAYFHPGETLTIGTAVRYTRSNSDGALLLADGTLASDRTNGRNIDLSLNWKPTVQTGANARLSWTRQSDSAGGSGFSGLTGALSFSYMPTGKLSFTGGYNRDASTNGSFYNTFTGTTNQSTVGLASNNSVSNSLSVGANYSATAKISAQASASYRRSTQDSDNGLVKGYRDTYRNYSLGANWAILRNWSLSCSISRVERQLSGGFAGDYSGNIYGCATQITLQ